jgi:hypothetical protein
MVVDGQKEPEATNHGAKMQRKYSIRRPRMTEPR